MNESLKLPTLKTIPPTPFYLYSESNLKKNLNSFLGSMPKDVDLHFALKANHNPKVLDLFLGHGLGIDIVSGGELEHSLKKGFASSKIVFSGVGKTLSELELAIDRGVGLINIESVFELDDVLSVAKKLNKRANIGFRLNPDVDAKTHPYIATGLQAHKFGISFEDSRAILSDLSRHQDLVALKGLSMHIGSQIRDLSAIREASYKLLEEAKPWISVFPELKTLDLGGGLAIDYESPQSMADFDSYSNILAEVLTSWKSAAGPEARLALELGRSLVGASGYLFTRVLGTKSNRGSHFCVVDASMTELIRPCLYQAHHEIIEFERSTSLEPTKTFDVVGPVCESSDVLGKARSLSSNIKRGDVLVICSAGAYGYVLSSVYNMRSLPAEYWLSESNELHLTRRSLAWSELNDMLLSGGI